MCQEDSHVPEIASSIAGPQNAWTLRSNICVKLCCQTLFHIGICCLYASMSTSARFVSATLSTTTGDGAF